MSAKVTQTSVRQPIRLQPVGRALSKPGELRAKVAQTSVCQPIRLQPVGRAPAFGGFR